MVLPFVKSSLRNLGEQKRTLAVVKGLSRAQNLQSREKLTICKKRCCSVLHDRAAGICLQHFLAEERLAVWAAGVYSCHLSGHAPSATSVLETRRSLSTQMIDWHTTLAISMQKEWCFLTARVSAGRRALLPQWQSMTSEPAWVNGSSTIVWLLGQKRKSKKLPWIPALPCAAPDVNMPSGTTTQPLVSCTHLS